LGHRIADDVVGLRSAHQHRLLPQRVRDRRNVRDRCPTGSRHPPASPPARPKYVAEAQAAFSDFVGEAVLIAHNGHRFDAKFLAAACERQRQRLASRPVALIDLTQLSKRLCRHSAGHSHGTDAILARTLVTHFCGRRHNAQGDVSGLAQAVTLMWRLLNLDATCSGIPRAGKQLPTLSR